MKRNNTSDQHCSEWSVLH